MAPESRGKVTPSRAVPGIPLPNEDSSHTSGPILGGAAKNAGVVVRASKRA